MNKNNLIGETNKDENEERLRIKMNMREGYRFLGQMRMRNCVIIMAKIKMTNNEALLQKILMQCRAKILRNHVRYSILFHSRKP